MDYAYDVLRPLIFILIFTQIGTLVLVASLHWKKE